MLFRSENCVVRDNGKSPVGHKFPADALLCIKAFAFLGRFCGAYATVNYAVFVIGVRHKKQERGNDGEHNVEKTLNIATPSLYLKFRWKIAFSRLLCSRQLYQCFDNSANPGCELRRLNHESKMMSAKRSSKSLKCSTS